MPDGRPDTGAIINRRVSACQAIVYEFSRTPTVPPTTCLISACLRLLSGALAGAERNFAEKRVFIAILAPQPSIEGESIVIKKRLTWMVIACAGIAALVAGGVASAEIVRLGNIELTVDGSFKPTKLPKHKLAPITLKVSSDIKTLDGTQPPVLNSLLLEFDKNGTLNTKGLPTCKSSQLENTLTAEAKRKCKDALIGKGSAKARIDFPDQDPFDAPGPLLAFNGKPKGGKPVILFHVFAHVPAPTTFVVPATVANDHGAFGKKVLVNVPPIAGGNGALTHFDVSIHRTWKYKGKKRSYVVAKCAGGHFVAQGTYKFNDGSTVTGSVVRDCKGKG